MIVPLLAGPYQAMQPIDASELTIASYLFVLEVLNRAGQGVHTIVNA